MLFRVYAKNLVCSASDLRIYAELEGEYAYAVSGVGFAVSLS